MPDVLSIPHSHACPKKSGGKHDATVCAAEGGLGYRPRVIAGCIREGDDGRLHFPTLCVCLVCHGYTSIVGRMDKHGERDEYCPENATRVALIEHGYLLAKRERMNVVNSTILPQPCRCGHLHSWKPAVTPVVGSVQMRLAMPNTIECEFCHVQTGVPDSSD